MKLTRHDDGIPYDVVCPFTKLCTLSPHRDVISNFTYQSHITLGIGYCLKSLNLAIYECLLLLHIYFIESSGQCDLGEVERIETALHDIIIPWS